jgi:ribosome-binding factor A
MTANRKARVEQALRDVLSGLIDRELKDPRLKAAGLVTINHVECNKDLSVARVHVSFFTTDEKKIAAAMKGLDTAAGFLRGPAGRGVSLARPPELRFVHDESIEFGVRLAAIRREDEQRAAETSAGAADVAGTETPADAEPPDEGPDPDPDPDPDAGEGAGEPDPDAVA